MWPGGAVGRVAVIGDVGGHADQLREALARLGTDGDEPRLPGGAQAEPGFGGAEHPPRLPEGLTVIQVGDLVDRGPDSTGVLDLVGRYLEEQPDQWIQLAGNHEAQYLPGGTPFWRERL